MIEELLQWEKLDIIQEAQVSAVSAGFAAASNLQLLRQDALHRNLGFQPQVLCTVRTAPFKGSHVLGPDPKENGFSDKKAEIYYNHGLLSSKIFTK